MPNSSLPKKKKGIPAHTEQGVIPAAEPFLNHVFIGDSRKMNAIPDSSIDLIVTSPPYFSIKDYSKDGYQQTSHSERSNAQLGDIGQFDEFISELLKVWRECERVLSPNGKLVINTPLVPMLKKDMTTHQSRHIFDLNSSIQNSIIRGLPKMFLLDTYIWNRTNPTKKLMFGSYPFPPNFYAQNTVEFVTVYVKDGKSRSIPTSIKDKSKLTQDEWVEFTKQVWNIPIPNKADKAFGAHSALMPEEIVRRCVRLYSFYGDTVLDPFTGSGTTLKVAKELGRNFVGYELVPTYQPIIESKIGSQVCRPAPKNRQMPLETGQVPTKLIDSIIKCDAMTFLKKIPDNSISLCCVDPPYNLAKGEWDTWPNHGEFMAFTKSWLDETIRVLKPGGSLYVFNTPRNSAYILQHLESRGMDFQNWITWDKRDGFASTKKRFVPTQETIIFVTKPGDDSFFDADAVRTEYDSTERIAAAAKKGILKNGKRWFPNPNGKLSTDVWHVTSERHKQKQNGKVVKTDHPTQKPIELIEKIVLASSKPGDIVLDCFMGSGTAAIAAMNNGRHFVGCEMDETFFKIAELRIKNELIEQKKSKKET